MNGVGSEDSSGTSVPKIMASYPPPPWAYLDVCASLFTFGTVDFWVQGNAVAGGGGGETRYRAKIIWEGLRLKEKYLRLRSSYDLK